jgi:arabinogalactan endo-1,4-beta-galactosidase
MNRAISTVRLHAPDTKIMLHYAGFDGSDWFFDKVKNLDYDLIGLSYYPIWHGKSIDSLKSKMNLLSRTYNKKIVIAETAYPFTLGWNDWTNNIVGLNEQLIMPDFPATVLGQKNFIKKIRTVTQEIELGYGFCYWGAELIAWKGNQSTQGSPWENQALFDFQNRALPVLSEFKAP